MATVATDHYRAYTPRPFTRAERDSVTILFGGLHWRVERIIQAVLESSGYKAQILPVATKQDLLTGRETADIGQCCPTSFTTGNLVNFLKKESKQVGVEEVNEKYVYLTAGSCGACRFGQYHASYELALRNSGLERFRMFLMAQDNLDQNMGDGLDLNLPKRSSRRAWNISTRSFATGRRCRPRSRCCGTSPRRTSCGRCVRCARSSRRSRSTACG